MAGAERLPAPGAGPGPRPPRPRRRDPALFHLLDPPHLGGLFHHLPLQREPGPRPGARLFAGRAGPGLHLPLEHADSRVLRLGVGDEEPLHPPMGLPDRLPRRPRLRPRRHHQPLSRASRLVARRALGGRPLPARRRPRDQDDRLHDERPGGRPLRRLPRARVRPGLPGLDGARLAGRPPLGGPHVHPARRLHLHRGPGPRRLVLRPRIPPRGLSRPPQVRGRLRGALPALVPLHLVLLRLPGAPHRHREVRHRRPADPDLPVHQPPRGRAAAPPENPDLCLRPHL